MSSSQYNQGPIVQIAKSNSQKSLYSNHDHDIDSPIKTNNKFKDKINSNLYQSKPQKEYVKINENNKNNYQEKNIKNSSNRQNNQKQKNKHIRHIYKNYHQFFTEEKSVEEQAKQLINKQFLTIDVFSKKSPRELLKFQQPRKEIFQMNDYEQRINFDFDNFKQNSKARYQSKTLQPSQNEQFKERALRSSQGGRWIRSRVIMQKKQKNSLEYLLRNYHKHQSKYFSQISNYLNILANTENNLSKKQYGFDIFSSLDEIKKKIQEYLEKKLFLQNIPIDKPTIEWTQSQLTQFFTKYQPIYINPSLIDSKSKLITLKKYKNCVYFGPMNNGKKHGAGVVYYYNGKIFQGTFQNDQKIQGVQIDAQMNQIYVGQFKKGLRSGQGLVKTNQYLFAGIFSNNQFDQNTSGVQVKNEDKFPSLYQTKNSNQFQMNKKITQGVKISFSNLIIYTQNVVVIKNSINDIYIGNHNLLQQKNGEGLQIFANGDVYIGKYQNDIPQGYGQYYWSSGAYYRGNFISGMRHGRGKWHMIHGDFYEGQYMNDKKNGKGTYIWKNGSKYVGQFQNDYRHGYGQMNWNDGKSYKGEWLNGIQKNVTIKLDKGSNSLVQAQIVAKPHHYLPGVTKNSLGKTAKSNSFSHKAKNQGMLKKKIPIQNLKSLYNPSNY